MEVDFEQLLKQLTERHARETDAFMTVAALAGWRPEIEEGSLRDPRSVPAASEKSRELERPLEKELREMKVDKRRPRREKEKKNDGNDERDGNKALKFPAMVELCAAKMAGNFTASMVKERLELDFPGEVEKKCEPFTGQCLRKLSLRGVLKTAGKRGKELLYTAGTGKGANAAAGPGRFDSSEEYLKRKAALLGKKPGEISVPRDADVETYS